MSGDVEGERWGEFFNAPARTIATERLHACFDGQFSTDLCGRLKSCSRLQARLSELISDRYHLGPAIAAPVCDGIDRSIALASADALAVLGRRAGAIYYAAAIANVILKEHVAVLREQLGDELFAFALAHRDLSGPDQSSQPLESFALRVEAAGWRCIGAWCSAQPAGIGMRVRLKLAPCWEIDGAPEGGFEDLACAIVRRAAG